MAYEVSPYLLAPCRDLPIACEQVRHARGLLTTPCGPCAVHDMCKRAMLSEAQAMPQQSIPVERNMSRVITRKSGHKAAA